MLRRVSSSGAGRLVCLAGDWAAGTVVACDPRAVVPPGSDPIDALATMPQVEDAPDGVIGGGWFGWIGYDGPAGLAFYDHLLRVDQSGDWWFEALWSADRAAFLAAQRAALRDLLTAPPARLPWEAGDFGGASMSAHLTAVENAVELIRAGELYQVNVCTRLGATFAGSAAGLFAEAVSALRPAFGAFVEADEAALAALSPELFLRRRGRHVTTSPIKGTWPAADPDGARALRASTKDAAENVMIVDLMRNDLGRVCVAGSVRVPTLLEVQRHPGVWHLVSTVTGELRESVDDADLIRATFPPGSVTGAPKVRAMSAIGELESGRRGAYTGAVGFVSPCWGAEWAVTIRSFEIRRDRIELGVGGGITADSVPMLEWRECLHKATPLLTGIGAGIVAELATPPVEPTAAQQAGGLLETIAVVDGEPLRLEDHLARLDRSSREVYRRGLPSETSARAGSAAQHAGPGCVTLRVHLRDDGDVRVDAGRRLTPPTASALRTVPGRSGLWRHKWADRAYFDDMAARLGRDGSEPLFLGSDGTVLETHRGNVFLLLEDGTLVTAPLGDDVLPGITRRAVLDLARDDGRPTQLRPFGVAELVQHAAFWTSSLSAAVPIASVDGIALPRGDDQVAWFAKALRASPAGRDTGRARDGRPAGFRSGGIEGRAEGQQVD
jgi:para-aminobenzoate synthetase/4-amino-4-deoxychorismate lyase